MGIQFTLTIEATDERQIRCYCGGQGPLVTSYQEYRDFLDQWIAAPYQLKGCEDEYCLADRPYEEFLVAGEVPLYTSVGSAGQSSLLETLGFTAEDDCGTVSAEDMEGRVLMALAVAPVSPEIPSFVEKGERGATMIHCVRPEGYTQDKLLSLQGVVEQAKRLGRDISWS